MTIFTDPSAASSRRNSKRAPIKRWTRSEVEELEYLLKRGMTRKRIAALLERTVKSVNSKIEHLAMKSSSKNQWKRFDPAFARAARKEIAECILSGMSQNRCVKHLQDNGFKVSESWIRRQVMDMGPSFSAKAIANGRREISEARRASGGAA